MINIVFKIGLYHYLLLAFLLFIIGFVGTIISKNIIKILICIEFMLTAVNINFVAFAYYVDNIKLSGFVFSLFYIALGAVEIAIALSIFYIMFKYKNSINNDSYTDLRG